MQCKEERLTSLFKSDLQVVTPKHVISRTPLRISFFGGGTDYPSYFLRHPGATLGVSINKYIYINILPLSRFFDYSLRISYSIIECVRTLEEILHPSIRACLGFQNLFPSINIHIASDLPAKTGLGSSSSFTVGFLNALYAMQQQLISKQNLALEACHIEQEILRENVGSQDQFHAAYGGMNLFHFSSSGIEVRPVSISLEKRELLERHLLVFFTGMTRFSHEILKEQIRSTKRFENDATLHKLYEMVFEAKEILDRAQPSEMVALLGAKLNESWELKKRLSQKISNPSIDAIYERGLHAGAYGGKLCGAGSGGFFAFLAPPEKHQNIRKAMGDLLEVDFRFEDEGSKIIYMKDG